MAGRSRTRHHFDIWPGFVDVLTTLLILLLFVLTVFTAAQIFLGDMLSGRDKRISELTYRMHELATLLAVERGKVEKAEKSIGELQAELRATLDARDLLAREKAALEKDKATLTDQRAALERRTVALDDQRGSLERRLGALERERTDMAGRIAALEQERGRLGVRVSALESEKRGLEADKRQLTDDRASLEARLRALEAERGRLAAQVTALDAQRRAAEGDRRTTEADKAKLAEEKTSLEQRIRLLELERGRLAGRVAALEGEKRAVDADKAKAAEDRAALEARVRTLEEEFLALARERDRLLAQLTAGDKAVGDQKKLTDEQAAELALLNRQLQAIRQQLAAVQAALDTSEAKTRVQKAEIDDLGNKLNAALATKVAELQRYRSEFFGRLRDALGNRADIRIVGDRFVFQSEVLFPVGSDEINPAGKVQLAQLARSLKEIAGKIPNELNWVLRVDGHTDRRPIRSAKFPSNWELSSARAIAVVRFLIDEGVPASRLVAAGFGEFQPLEGGETEDSFGRNRRIELKLTER